nr:MAG TPA: hypothetical protein [Caudoviricetes sp.]
MASTSPLFNTNDTILLMQSTPYCVFNSSNVNIVLVSEFVALSTFVPTTILTLFKNTLLPFNFRLSAMRLMV